jgi:hypothetical protein
MDTRTVSGTARAIEARLCAAGASKRGVDYMLMAIDPFHDGSLVREGLPDMECGMSNVYCIQKSLQVAKPAALGATDLWDMHVAISPEIRGNSGGHGLSVLGSTPAGCLYPAAYGHTDFQTGRADSDDGILVGLTGATSPVYTGWDVAGSVIPPGLLQICGVAAGGNTFDPQVGAFYDSLGVANIFAKNQMCRVVGFAAEVVNSTAPNFASGTCRAYRNLSETSDTCSVMAFNTNNTLIVDLNGAGATAYANTVPGQVPVADEAINAKRMSTRTLRRRRLPPQNVEQVVQLNSRFWHATKGVLLPGIMSVESNPPKYPQNEGLMCLGSVEYTDLTALNAGTPVSYLWPDTDIPIIDADRSFRTGFCTAGRKVVYTDSTAVNVTQGVEMSKETETFSIPCAQSGAYFCGLSPETTMSIELKVFIEAFPFPGNSDYAMASPSTPLDSVVLNVLPKLFWELDPGYPQDWNSIGKFFKELWDKVKKLVPVIPMIAEHYLPGTGKIVQTGIDLLGKSKKQPIQASKLKQPTVRGMLPRNKEMMNGGAKTGLRPPSSGRFARRG